MQSGRAGVLTALLLTAALFAAMPGALRACLPAEDSRADERLKPPRIRMLTVWLLPGAVEDAALVRRLCTQFEEQHDGVRVFLRTARAEELYAPDAVLPDAVFFDTGSVTDPAAALLPLAQEGHASGCYGGVCYALPLWLEVYVLCTQEEHPPWERLIEPGSLNIPPGTSMQQLMLMCPPSLRQHLPAAMGGDAAQVRTLRQHIRREDGLHAQVMTPAVSDRVRYIALCRESEEARAFVQFAAESQEAASHHLLPLCGAAEGHALLKEAQAAFAVSHTLPNAFAHSREGLQSLCLHAFEQGRDPAQTLLELR